jgi:hypothetical protein
LQRQGDTAVYFFDNIDFKLVKKQAISRNSEMDNAPMDIFYSNYQATEKIKIPHTIICKSSEQTILTITVDSVKLNTPIDNNIFQPGQE